MTHATHTTKNAHRHIYIYIKTIEKTYNTHKQQNNKTTKTKKTQQPNIQIKTKLPNNNKKHIQN